MNNTRSTFGQRVNKVSTDMCLVFGVRRSKTMEMAEEEEMKKEKTMVGNCIPKRFCLKTTIPQRFDKASYVLSSFH